MIIYPKDIQIITGRSVSYAQYIIRVIRRQLGKNKNQFITRKEFCKFAGLDPDEVDEYLG